MKASELFHMLNEIYESDPLALEDYQVVLKNNISVSGVWFDHINRRLIMVQRDTRIENRVDT